MWKKIKLFILITIALLSYSTNLYANDNIDVSQPSYGGADSTLISFDDLRIVNSKLIELEYEKKINVKLREIIANDSIIMVSHAKIQQECKKDVEKITKQRNIFIGTTIGVTIVGLVTALLIAN